MQVTTSLNALVAGLLATVNAGPLDILCVNPVSGGGLEVTLRTTDGKITICIRKAA